MHCIFPAKSAVISECKTYSIFHDYTINWSSSLGTGASGRVRSGVNINTGANVAIKILTASETTRHEIKTHLSCLRSHDKATSYIVDILDVYYNELRQELPAPNRIPKGMYYILVLEHMDGRDLYHRIVAHGVFNEPDARVIIHSIIESLQIVQATPGLIAHGDIKPENLLFTSSEGISSDGQRLKLADFGLSITKTDQRRSYTPFYVDPYTLSTGGRRTEVSDIWSLGVVMYILLTGYAPFSSENQLLHPQSMSQGMRQRILQGEFYKYEEWSALSGEAKDLIRRMLTVDHKQRITLQGVKEHPWTSA